MLKMFLIYSAFFGSPVLHACYLFFTGQVLKGSLHPKEQPMHYQMETLLGGLPSMEVRDQKDYIMQMKFSLIDCKLCALNSRGNSLFPKKSGRVKGKQN